MRHRSEAPTEEPTEPAAQRQSSPPRNPAEPTEQPTEEPIRARRHQHPLPQAPRAAPWPTASKQLPAGEHHRPRLPTGGGLRACGLILRWSGWTAAALTRPGHIHLPVEGDGSGRPAARDGPPVANRHHRTIRHWAPCRSPVGRPWWGAVPRRAGRAVAPSAGDRAAWRAPVTRRPRPDLWGPSASGRPTSPSRQESASLRGGVPLPPSSRCPEVDVGRYVDQQNAPVASSG